MTLIIIDNGTTEAFTDNIRDFTGDLMTGEQAKTDRTATIYKVNRGKLQNVIRQIRGANR